MDSPTGPSPPPPPTRPEGRTQQLSPLLVWAVVFCDIGTSVYYVPGILYASAGNTTALLVFGTAIGFILLALKYIEISWRNPEGGGVVTIATKAFTPLWGVLGGWLIVVDYFLTAAISSVSGMHYLGSLVPAVDHRVIPLAIAILILLAFINIVGIRESAILSFFVAGLALAVDLVVIVVTLVRIGPPEWGLLAATLKPDPAIGGYTLLVGFSGAWLAYSGLESISQLSPAMKDPIKSTARQGMIWVIGSILVTAPILTLFSIGLLPRITKENEGERLISELGQQWGGAPVEIAVVVTASALLLLAANTAIIGAYHVFLALARSGYMPTPVVTRNRRFGTPQIAILVATCMPILIILAVSGNLTALGDMYAFGLLGAFTLSSVSLDVVRWRVGNRGPLFWVGIATTVMVLVAWWVNLIEKDSATTYGGTVVGVGMLVAVLWHQRWFHDLFYRIPSIQRRAQFRIAQAERGLSSLPNLINLNLAQVIVPANPSDTLVALRGRNAALLEEAAGRERGRGGSTLYVLYVEERPGLFVDSESVQPDPQGLEVLAFAAARGDSLGLTVVPLWTVSYNAAEGISRAAELLHVGTVMLGVSRRNAIYHLLRGHVVSGLVRRLPRRCKLMLLG